SADQIILPAPGKVLVVGTEGFEGATVALQLNSNATPDLTFGDHGVATFKRSDDHVAAGARAAVTPDGKVVVDGVDRWLGSPTGTITDVDDPIIRFTEEVPTVTLSVNAANALENGGDASILFKRDAAYNFNTRVFFSTSGTATPLADYTGALAPSMTILGP